MFVHKHLKANKHLLEVGTKKSKHKNTYLSEKNQCLVNTKNRKCETIMEFLAKFLNQKNIRFLFSFLIFITKTKLLHSVSLISVNYRSEN